MIVTIKEYSTKTGKGTAVNELGQTIRFTYKQFKNHRMIPVGEKANLIDNVLSPVQVIDTISSTISKLFRMIRGKLWL